MESLSESKGKLPPSLPPQATAQSQAQPAALPLTTKAVDAEDVEGPQGGKAGSLDSDEGNWVSITSSEADLVPGTSSKLPPQDELTAAADAD